MSRDLSSVHTPPQPSAGADPAEAARYALLRRLAPALRHHLVVHLQPIGLVCEVARRRLRGPQPDVAPMLDGAQKINGFARAALGSCVDVMTWLAPDDDVPVPLGGAVRECTGMLASSLSFRGYVLQSEMGDNGPGRVRRTAVRNVLTALLVQATDEQPAPAQLVLTAQARAEGAVLRLQVRATPGDAASAAVAAGLALEGAYRPLTPEDVQALARAEQVGLQTQGAGWALTFPWVGDVPA